MRDGRHVGEGLRGMLLSILEDLVARQRAGGRARGQEEGQGAGGRGVVVGGNEVDVYAGDTQDGLPLEARGVEAGAVSSGIVVAFIIFGEDVEGGTGTEGVRGAVGKGLRAVDVEGEELEESSDGSWNGEPAARVVGHDGAGAAGAGAAGLYSDGATNCRIWTGSRPEAGAP